LRRTNHRLKTFINEEKIKKYIYILPMGYRLVVALSVRAGRLACSYEIRGYAGGSIATGRVSLAGLALVEESDEGIPQRPIRPFRHIPIPLPSLPAP